MAIGINKFIDKLDKTNTPLTPAIAPTPEQSDMQGFSTTYEGKQYGLRALTLEELTRFKSIRVVNEAIGKEQPLWEASKEGYRIVEKAVNAISQQLKSKQKNPTGYIQNHMASNSKGEKEMAFVQYGDVSLTVDDNVLSAQAVEHVLTEVKEAFRTRQDPTAWLCGQEFERNSPSHNIIYKHFAVKEAEEEQIQVDLIKYWLRATASAAALQSFQVLYDALKKVPALDTGGKSNGLLGDIPVGYHWNPKTKKRESGTEPVGWNQAKLSLLDMMAGLGNLKSEISSGITIVARHDTVRNFYTDEQSTKMFAVSHIPRDPYNNLWCRVGQFPNAGDGTAQGITREGSIVGGTTYYIADEFAFDPMCVKRTTSSTEPEVKMEIYRDQNAKEIRFRASIYKGAKVVKPKGVIRIKNALSQTN